MIKIIGGQLKGKKINVYEEYVRPTSAIKREAIFSILESYAIKNDFELYKNKSFIDLFAGSGSVGLEAISRGMSHSYFYEKNNKVFKILKENCIKISDEKKFTLRNIDCNTFNKEIVNYPISIVFIDPPYKLNPFNELLDLLLDNENLTEESILIIEIEKKTKIKINDKYTILKEKVYGKTKIIFLQRL